MSKNMRSSRKLFLLMVLVLMLTALLPAAIIPKEVKAAVQATYYVSTTGNDTTGDGSIGNPWATIQKARDVVRATKGTMTGDIYIYIRGGKYYLDSTVSFNENDSGNNGYMIYYKNYPSETPEINAGQKVTDWTLYSGSIYRAYVGTSWKFYTLFENGERCITARHPNTGYKTVESGFAAPDDKNKFVYRLGDLPTFSIADAQVCIYSGGSGVENYDFWMDILPVTNVNTSTRTITLGAPGTSYSIAANNRYYVRGAYEFLDQPGEFYLNESTGYLYYWPRKTPINSQEIIAPKTKRIIELQGSSTTNLVQYINFEGLTLADSDSLKTADGYMDLIDGVVYMKNTKFNTVKNCFIQNAGLNGITLDKYAQNNTLYGNLIQNAGNDCIKLNGWEPGQGGATATAAYANNTINNTISNNFVMGSGIIVENGSGIFCYHSGDNEISYNEVRNTAKYGIGLACNQSADYMLNPPKVYYGVTCTYDNHWDFLFTRNNTVMYNDVYDCLKKTHDIGAIGAGGTGKYNVIDNNRIHDSQTGITGSKTGGIYIDNGADYFTVKNNIVYGITAGTGIAYPLANHGTNNTWLNNICADNSASYDMRFWEAGSDLSRNNVIKYNIFQQASLSTIYQFDTWIANATIFECNYNAYHHSGGGTVVSGIPGPQTYANWRTIDNYKYDQNSSTSPVVFQDPYNHNYTVTSGAPTGFVNIDQASIGLKSDFPYKVYNDNNAAITYTGTGWGVYNDKGAYRTDYHESKTAGNYYEISFNGTNAKVYGMKLYNMGKADVYVDGTFKDTIDLYSEGIQYDALYYDTGTLSNGPHTIKVQVRSDKNPSSTDYWVMCDMVIVMSMSSSSDTTVDFEAYTTNGQVISGVYAGIDWGSTTPSWTSYDPDAGCGMTSRNAYVNSLSTGAVSKTIVLPSNSYLKSIKIGTYTGNTGTVQFSNTGNPTVTYTLVGGTANVFTTGWTTATNQNVIITITNNQGAGNVCFDDLVYGTPGDTTVDFEAYTTDDQVISGTYAGIDWGATTPSWQSWHSFGGLTTRCAYVNSASPSAVTKTITIPANAVLKSVRIGYNDYGSNATVTLHSSVAGNTDKTFTISSANRGQSFTTGWINKSASSSTVDITITYYYGAYYVGFDDLVYGP